jgi:2-isopropylmalate synthase
VSSNILEASYQAVVEGIEYGLYLLQNNQLELSGQFCPLGTI